MGNTFCDQSRTQDVDAAERLEIARRYDLTIFPIAPGTAGDTGVEAVIDLPATWGPHPVINIHFVGGTAADQARVKQVTRIWENSIDVFFTFDPAKPSDIRIAFDSGNGNWSALGIDSKVAGYQGRPTMNLANRDGSGALEEATILHEFGHALGLYHEHQHPQITLQWNEATVIADLGGPPNNWKADKARSQVLTRLSPRAKVFGAYDHTSIMHYDIPPTWHVGAFQIGPNKSLSPEDVARSKVLYPDARALAVLGAENTERVIPRPPKGFEALGRIDADAPGVYRIDIHGGDLTAAVVLEGAPERPLAWARSQNGSLSLVLDLPAGSHPLRIRADADAADPDIVARLVEAPAAIRKLSEPDYFRVESGDTVELVLTSLNNGVALVTFGDPVDTSGHMNPEVGHAIDLRQQFVTGNNQVNLRHVANSGPWDIAYELRINGVAAPGSPFAATGTAGFMNRMHRVADLVFRYRG
jgi:Astacin (Peptidase family M12A)